jgi:MFS family permease
MLICLQLAYVLNFFHRQLPALMAPQLMEAFSLSKTEVGLLAGTAFALVYAVAGVVVSFYGSGKSLRIMIGISVAAWSATVMFTSFASSAQALFLWRMLFAVLQSAVTPQIYALLAMLFQAGQRGGVISWYATGIYAGLALSFAAGGFFASMPWQHVYLYSGVPGLGIALVLLVLLPAGRYANEKSVVTWKDIGALYAGAAVRWHTLGFSLLSVTGYSMLTFASLYIAQYGGGREMLLPFALFMVGTAASVLIAGLVSDHLAITGEKNRFLVPVVTTLAGSGLYAAGFLTTTPSTAFLLFGFGMVFTSSYNGLAPAMLQNMVEPQLRAVAGAVYLLVINVAGLGGGPPLTGYLADKTGSLPLAMMLVMAVCNVLAVAAFASGFRAMRRSVTTQ